MGYEHEQREAADFMRVLQDYLPQQKDIRGKGSLSGELAFLLSATTQYYAQYADYGLTQENYSAVTTLMDDIENRLISVDAKSRTDFTQILGAWIKKYVYDEEGHSRLGYHAPVDTGSE